MLVVMFVVSSVKKNLYVIDRGSGQLMNSWLNAG